MKRKEKKEACVDWQAEKGRTGDALQEKKGEKMNIRKDNWLSLKGLLRLIVFRLSALDKK